MQKILLIEDDKKIRRYLELEFLQEDYQLEFAVDGEEGIAKAKAERYDLILLDLMLPKISGEEVCREIRKFTGIPIIVLTAKSDMESKLDLLELGADDYITKPFIIEELFARIKVLFRRQNQYSRQDSNILIFKNIRIDNEGKSVTVDGNPVSLTKTEFNLLHYFLLNRDLVLSREQILFNVWGSNYMGDEKIVDAYIKNLRKKTGISDIKTVRGFGYSLKSDAS